MDDPGPSNWHNQHSESSEDEGLDDLVDEDNFPILIHINSNEIYSQLATLVGGLYLLTLRRRKEVANEFTRACTLDQ